MKLLGTRTYISLGLVSLVSSALLAASFLGLVPDRAGAVREGRIALAESIAASSTALLSSSDPRRLEVKLHDVLMAYLAEASPVAPDIEGRAKAIDAPGRLLSQVEGTSYRFR